MIKRSTWTNTTHDWAMTVDPQHLQLIRDQAGQFAPGGLQHLILEILAHANDEAESLGRRGNCTVSRHSDGTISVTDDGRGTDTRRDERGQMIRKPVMATKDLRFFDSSRALLPDGHPRRGMSVVAALSTWLEHSNHRSDGGWTQRYEHGIPVGDLIKLTDSARTGTTVRFLPDTELLSAEPEDPALYLGFPWIAVNTSNG